MRSNPGFSTRVSFYSANSRRQRTAWRIVASFLLAITISPWLGVIPAYAQAMSTYVSGTGKDDNPCTTAMPCQTLQAALAKTIAGGQIIALDSANYGYVTIDKAVSITSGRGATGVLAVSSVSGITINASSNDVISLHGLHIDGAGSGANGIHFTGGAALNVQDSVIRGFTSGINVQSSGSSALSLNNTLVSNNSTGIQIQSAAASNGIFNNVQLVNNGSGLITRGASSMAQATVTMQDSVVTNNSTVGILADSYSTVRIVNSTIANNGIGLQAQSSSALVEVSSSTVTGNGTGWLVADDGRLYSAANNAIGGNASGNEAPLTGPDSPTQPDSPTEPESPTEPQEPTASNVIAKNIVTDFGAKCDGVADDRAAFAAFNTWAVANQGDQLVHLTIPSGAICTIKTSSQNNRFFKGIKKLLVSGYGATLRNESTSNLVLGGLGTVDGPGQRAELAGIAEAGTFRVRLADPSKASWFAAGQWLLVAGIDLQGTWGINYGYPINNHYFEWKKVKAVSGDMIEFEEPLKNTYKPTWPKMNDKHGGPGSLFRVDPSWDAEIEYRGLTIENHPNAGVNAGGRHFILKDMNFASGGFGVTQKKLMVFDNVTMPKLLEIDKLIETFVVRNSTLRGMDFQSSSVDTVIFENTIVDYKIGGTPKRTFISGSTIESLTLGALGFGRSDEIVCVDSVIKNVSGSSLLDAGDGVGIQNIYEMTDGVMTLYTGTRVTGAANNGSGTVRLTVNSTAPLLDGKFHKISLVGGTTEANGTRPISIVDETHIDLPGVNFVNPYTSGGVIRRDTAPRWAVPGTYLFWDQYYQGRGMFQVTDVIFDGNKINVHTTWPGGFPTFAEGSGLRLRAHPAPRVTFKNCTGSPEAVELSQAPAGAPINSYRKRSYDASTGYGSSAGSAGVVWGRLVSLKINVTKPYTGTRSSLRLRTAGGTIIFQKPDFSTVKWQPFINAKIAGERVITPSEVTGAQSGDSNLTGVDPLWWAIGTVVDPSPEFDISGEDPSVWPEFTIEIVTDQGVVSP